MRYYYVFKTRDNSPSRFRDFRLYKLQYAQLPCRVHGFHSNHTGCNRVLFFEDAFLRKTIVKPLNVLIYENVYS